MSRDEDRKAALKQRFLTQRGYWSDLWEDVLASSEAFFEGYIELSSIPWKNGHLPPRLKELIYIAIDITVPHLFVEGTRIHMANALKYGASRDDIIEVMQMAALTGLRAGTVGLSVVFEEIERAGMATSPQPRDDARRAALRTQFMETHGYWDAAWEAVLAASPDYFAACLRLSVPPRGEEGLTAKERELIFIALDAVAPGPFEPGLRLHIREALRHGATIEEIVEALQIASVIGVHSVTTGLPILKGVGE